MNLPGEVHQLIEVLLPRAPESQLLDGTMGDIENSCSDDTGTFPDVKPCIGRRRRRVRFDER
jgi:hypothetical protein